MLYAKPSRCCLTTAVFVFAEVIIPALNNVVVSLIRTLVSRSDKGIGQRRDLEFPAFWKPSTGSSYGVFQPLYLPTKSLIQRNYPYVVTIMQFEIEASVLSTSGSGSQESLEKILGVSR